MVPAESAAALGNGLLDSTYNTANTVPTNLHTLLIGGALNAVLVPQLVRARAAGTLTLGSPCLVLARLMKISEPQRLPGLR